VWILWKKFLVVFFKDVNLNGAAGIIAVVASTVLLVIFSEIIPQAVCSRHGLAIGAFFAWPVRILICVLFIVAWPIAKVLDMLLGSQHGVLYRSAELKELIAMHATTQEKGGDLQTDAVTILQGALDLQTKSVRHAMTPLNQTFMLSINTILDRKTMAKILRSGHSRIPIFDGPADQTLADRNITGVLLVKSLILLDPDDNTPLKDVKLGSMPQVDPKMSLFELLNVFQEGGSKLAKTYFQKSARQLLIATYIGHMATVFESDEADSTISDGSNSSIVPSSKKKHRFRRASGSSTSSSSSSESHHFFSRLRRGRKSDIEKGGDTDSQPRDDHAIEIKTEPDEQDKLTVRQPHQVSRCLQSIELLVSSLWRTFWKN
jgi:metal transporter CNNM